MADKVFIEALPRYSDYFDISSLDLAMSLPEYTGMNNHTIKVEQGKQPLSKPIYSLGLMKLERLKTYI